MNKNVKQGYRSRLSRQLLLQYLFTLIGFVAALCFFIIAAMQFCNLFTWYSDDLLYIILWGIRRNILFFAGILVLAGWTAITYHYISKPLHYLDEVVSAAGLLVASPEQPVTLPPALLDTQNELNLVRESALASARAAKDAEQRKNDLIVYLAHDLKTPLTSVIGYLALLRDEPQITPALRAKYTGIALAKAERLEELLNEFFDITRFNLTALTLDAETVNLTRMLEQITYEFNPVLQEKALHWQNTLAPEVLLRCDPDKMERVFDNLLRNAVSYSYPGSALCVTLETRADAAVIRVANHGRTIPPEKLSRIFEQFFRLDSARASATGGAGLGLAIAKEIIELHGGTITAESAEETIVFTVTLPLDRQKIV